MTFFKQYKSGLRLVATQLENFYTVSFGVFVNVGSVLENEKNNGYSHFIEHLLFKGTKRRTALQISEAIDDLGATMNAYTSKDCTCFYTKSATRDLEKCIDVLSDMYFNAEIPADELEKERGVVLEEIKMCEDTPDDVSQDLISSALFFSQPLGQTILGNPQNIKYSDRHSILKFKNNHYFAANTVISVAGKFDLEQLDKFIQQYFESNFSGENCGASSAEPAVSYTDKFLHRFKPIEQAHVEMAFGGFSVSAAERHATSVLASTLGGGATSRLFQSLREKHGLVYSVFSYPSFYSNCGMFEIYAGLSPQNVRKACLLIQDEIRRFVDDGITEKELARARLQAENGLYMNLESNLTLMRLHGRCLLKTGALYDPEKEIERYNQLTADEVNALAKKLFVQPHASSYVGPENADFNFVSQLSGKILA